MKEFLYRNRHICLLAGFLMILCILPLALTRIPSGHDISFHMSRLTDIAANIRDGEWFAPIYYAHGNGYGYASPLFYGDLFLYLPGLGVAAGLDCETAMRCFFILCVTGTAFATYFCARSMMKNSFAAFLTAIAYTFSSYLCIDFLVRVAVGEVQAFFFCPIVLLGFHSIVYEDGKHWLCLPVGLAGLLLSHTLSAVMMVIFLVLFAVANYDRFFKKPRRFATVAVSAAVFFALTAYFIFPMLEQLNSVSFKVTDGYTATIWGTLSSRAMPWWSVLCDFNQGIKTDAWIPNGIGLGIIATVVAAIWLRVKKMQIAGRGLLYLLSALLSLLLASAIFPWNIFQALCGNLQFPWRFLLFATLFAAFAAGYVVERLSRSGKNEKYITVFAAILIFASIFSYYTAGSGKYITMVNNAISDKEIKTDYANGIGAGEYLPSGTNFNALLSRGDTLTASDYAIQASCVLRRGTAELTVSYENNAGGGWIEVPLLNYKGWNAYRDDGTKLVTTYGENNVIRVWLGEAASGTITVRYELTTVQLVSRFVSVFALAGIVVYLIVRALRRRKAPKPSQTNTPAPTAPEESPSTPAA